MIWNPLDNCEYATLSRGHKWTLQVGYRSGNRHLNYWGRISTLGISPIAQPRLRVMASHDGIAHLCPLALGLEASGTHACPRRPGDISYHCMLRLVQQRTLSQLIPPRRWILIARMRFFRSLLGWKLACPVTNQTTGHTWDVRCWTVGMSPSRVYICIAQANATPHASLLERHAYANEI